MRTCGYIATYQAGCRCARCRAVAAAARRYERGAHAAPGLSARLAEAFGRAEWMQDAKCRGLNPALFFVPRGCNGYEEALAVCAECPVTTECLVHAKRTGERDGVWGGLTPRQRRKVKVA